MEWQYATTAEIDGQIARLEADRTAWQHQGETANRTKLEALVCVDIAQAQEDVASAHVRGDTAEIAVLRAERAAQSIPPARIAR